MAAWIWLALPALPLLSVFVAVGLRLQVRPWLWLTAVPAILVALAPPAALSLPVWWYGAEWGAEDIITRAWLGFTGTVWACAAVAAAKTLERDRRQSRFWVFWQLALSGNLLLIVAQDAVSFYLGFSLMSLAAYGLIVHNKGPLPRRAGRIYLQLAVLGEMLLLAGMLLHVHAADGAIGFDSLRQTPLGAPAAALILLSLGIKAGFWPLHIWLPLAHPAAPAPASAVLSGAMIKAGVLGIWRFLPAGDPLLQQWSSALLLVGAISAFYGVAVGLTRTHAKSVLAYSSVSQIGYMMIITAIAWRHPEHADLLVVALVLFAVHHGIAKAALFLAAGLAGLGRLPRLLLGLLPLPALALAGLPLTSGGAAKDLLKYRIGDSAFAEAGILLTLGSFATALLLMRAMFLLIRTQRRAPAARVSGRLLLPWALLSSLPVLLPLLWPLMRQPWQDGLGLLAIWTGLWPIILALAVGGAAVRLGYRLPRGMIRLPNPGLNLSLRFKRLQQRPPVPAVEFALQRRPWRQRERSWNRFWRRDIVTASGWMLCTLLILLGWLG